MDLDNPQELVPPGLRACQGRFHRRCFAEGEHQGPGSFPGFGLAQHADDFLPLTGSQPEGDPQRRAWIESRSSPAGERGGLHGCR